MKPGQKDSNPWPKLPLHHTNHPGEEITKVHIASTPTQQKKLTSFETVRNPNQ